MPAAESLAPPALKSNREAVSENSSARLMCLDVFRGLAVAGMILVDNPGSDEKAYHLISHAEWNGWTPADLIFPSFLFLVGVSLVFSFAKRAAAGQSRRQILFHVFKRSLLLIAIGLLVNASPFIGLDLHSWRFEGVTQRIALCYFVAALLELWSGRRAQILAIVACLFGYWALLRFAPVPGLGVPGRDFPFMDPDRNIAAWFDRKLFMGHLFEGTRDPEGIISTIPAIATTLIGVLTGHWLRARKSPRTKNARHAARWNSRPARRPSLEHLVPHQQKSLDQLLRPLHRRLRPHIPGFALLDPRNQKVVWRLDHAHSRVWHECHRGLRCRFARLRPWLQLHREELQRRRHQLARCRTSPSANTRRQPTERLPDLFTRRRTILLDPVVAALAQTHFSQGLILPRSR